MGIFGSVSDAVDSAQDAASDAADTVTDAASDAADSAQDAASDAVDSATDAASDAADTVTDAVGGGGGGSSGGSSGGGGGSNTPINTDGPQPDFGGSGSDNSSNTSSGSSSSGSSNSSSSNSGRSRSQTTGGNSGGQSRAGAPSPERDPKGQAGQSTSAEQPDRNTRDGIDRGQFRRRGGIEEGNRDAIEGGSTQRTAEDFQQQAQEFESDIVSDLQERGVDIDERDVRISVVDTGEGRRVLEPELSGEARGEIADAQQRARRIQEGAAPAPDNLTTNVTLDEQSVPDDDGIVGEETSAPPEPPDPKQEIRERAAEAQRQRNESPVNETFGGRGQAEQDLRNASQTISEDVVDPVAGFVGATAETSGDVFAAGSPEASGPSKRKEQQTANVAANVTRGAGEVLNPASLGVAAIEGGEVVADLTESAPVAGGSAQETRETLDQVGDAAALQGVTTARAVQENPTAVGAQLVGGAALGAGAVRGAQRVAGPRTAEAVGFAVDPTESVTRSLIRGSPDSPDAPTARSQVSDDVGTQGTGTLLQEGDIPSQRPGNDERGLVGDIERQLREFAGDESGQLQVGRQRQRQEPDTGDTPISRDEILGGSTRDRIGDDVTRRAQQQRRQAQGTFERQATDPGASRRTTQDQEGRLREAQRREARVDDSGPSGDSRSAARTQAEAGVAGALDRLADAEAAQTGIGVGVGAESDAGTQPLSQTGLDVGVRPLSSPGTRPESRQTPGVTRTTGTPGRTGTPTDTPDPTGRTGDPTDGTTRTQTRTRVTTPPSDQTTPDPTPRPDVDDDDDNQLLRGVGGQPFGSAASQADGQATGFVAETLTGFGEGGLNVDAAEAAGRGSEEFLQTEAQAEGSEGFEAAQDLFGVGEDG